MRIDSTLDRQVKYDIFERLNSGSVKLEAQELRNAVSRGPFNRLIKKLAENEDFRTMLQIDLKHPSDNKKVQKMLDVELVLRFFALSDSKYENIRKGFKSFLSDQMDELNKLSTNELDSMGSSFGAAMREIRDTLGDKAFAKYRFENDEPIEMSSFNAAVFDAVAVAFNDVLNAGEHQVPDGFKDRFIDLFSNEEFFRAVEGSVNDRAKVIKRIQSVKEIL